MTFEAQHSKRATKSILHLFKLAVEDLKFSILLPLPSQLCIFSTH